MSKPSNSIRLRSKPSRPARRPVKAKIPARAPADPADRLFEALREELGL